MKDINGQEFRKGGLASLLCEVLDVEPFGVRIRILNSHEDLLVGCRYDEVMDGLVADSELIVFDEPAPARTSPDDQADGVKLGVME